MNYNYSVRGRSLSICYHFAGDCPQACDGMQKNQTIHPFTFYSRAFENYFHVPWVSAEENKATTQNVWGYFTTIAHTDPK